MPLPATLLALVLLVLCGGIEPAWTPAYQGDGTECPIAPEAPAEAESEGGGEEAICARADDAREEASPAASGTTAEARSAEESVEIRPPRG